MNIDIGCHVSIAGSLDQAIDRALERQCTTFQIFTRNPRGWKFSSLDVKEIEEFRRKAKENNYKTIVAHMPYLPNLATPRDDVYKASVETLSAEVERCGKLGITFLVTHLGSHMGVGTERGLQRLTTAVNKALENNKNEVIVLLENMAGTKNNMGSTFEDIRKIMDEIKCKKRVGLCFDTCHAFAAGYDLRNEKTVNETMVKLDEKIGLDKVKLIHANDCKGDLGCHLDRHEHIGLGGIGSSGFKAILSHRVLRSLPFVLETPIDERRDEFGDIHELKAIASMKSS